MLCLDIIINYILNFKLTYLLMLPIGLVCAIFLSLVSVLITRRAAVFVNFSKIKLTGGSFYVTGFPNRFM